MIWAFRAENASGWAGRAVQVPRQPQPSRVKDMERTKSGELEGQRSINELLDQPIGDSPVQLGLPILLQVKPGQFRRLS